MKPWFVRLRARCKSKYQKISSSVPQISRRLKFSMRSVWNFSVSRKRKSVNTLRRNECFITIRKYASTWNEKKNYTWFIYTSRWRTIHNRMHELKCSTDRELVTVKKLCSRLNFFQINLHDITTGCSNGYSSSRKFYLLWLSGYTFFFIHSGFFFFFLPSKKLMTSLVTWLIGLKKNNFQFSLLNLSQVFSNNYLSCHRDPLINYISFYNTIFWMWYSIRDWIVLTINK